MVETVTGPVAAADLGFTLPHEHTYIDLWSIPGRFDYEGQLADEDVLAAELAEYAELGGRTIVDLTLPGMGRDVGAVAALARRTGLNVVVGTGWYREPYYPPEARIDRRSVAALADEMVREADEGIDGTGIRAGVIGEIGVDKRWVSAQEERVCRAAGRARAGSPGPGCGSGTRRARRPRFHLRALRARQHSAKGRPRSAPQCSNRGIPPRLPMPS